MELSLHSPVHLHGTVLTHRNNNIFLLSSHMSYEKVLYLQEDNGTRTKGLNGYATRICLNLYNQRPTMVY
jgi:hypothetical protein